MSPRTEKALVAIRDNRKKIILGGLAIVALTLLLRLPYVHYAKLNPDETIYAVIGREILHGAVPYRDVWELKPPLIFYLYAGIFLLVGSSSLVPVHVFAVIVMAATALALANIARKEWGNAAGLIAGLGMAGYSTAGWMTEVNAAETELFLLFPQVMAVDRFIHKRPDKLARDLFLAGFLAGIAAMFKQPAAGLIVLMVLWVAVAPLVKKRRFMTESALIGGAILVPLIFSIYFLSEGGFKDAFNLTVMNNFRYIGERGRGDVLRMMINSGAKLALPNIILWGIGLISAGVVLIKSFKHENGKRILLRHAVFISLYLLVCTLGTFSGIWVNGHYYLMMIPGLVMMWTWGIIKLWPQIKSKTLHAFFAAVLLVGMCFPLYYYHLHHRKSTIETYLDSRINFFTSLGEKIRQETNHEDRIFVWGMNPQIYYFAKRRPASRFIYTTFQMGLVENTYFEKGLNGNSRFEMPETWPPLRDDLEKSRPKLIIDSTSYYKATKPYPIVNYPDLLLWMSDDYGLIFNQRGFLIFKENSHEL